MGCAKGNVEGYFKSKIFLELKPSDTLICSMRLLILKHIVLDVRSKLEVSTPIPNILYGYCRHRAFPHQQT